MKLSIEVAIVSAFFIVALYLGPAAMLNHTVNHPFPYAYLASDAFQHQVRADAIKETGNFKYETDYISLGLTGVEGRYPPGLYHLAVLFGNTAGIPVYDAIVFLVYFFAVISMLIMFFVIKHFNSTVAILSLPCSMLIFSFPPIVGFLWGHWPSLLGQVFLIGFIWVLINNQIKYQFIFLALFLASIIITHTSEAIFAVLLLGSVFLYEVMQKGFSLGRIVNMSSGVVIAFIITSYFLIIFNGTWLTAQSYSFHVMPIWEGNPGFYLTGFGLLLVIFALGMISSLTKMKDMPLPPVIGFIMLLIGFTNLIGFNFRAFQIRFFWPLYLSIFFGLGIYMILKLLVRKWGMLHNIIAFFLFMILLSGIISVPILAQAKTHLVPSVPTLYKSSSPGIMNQYHWDMLQWLSMNTEKSAKVYFFYGDLYSQDALLRNAKRVHAQVDVGDFIESLQNRTIRRYYLTEVPGDSGGMLGKRESMFRFNDAMSELPKDYPYGRKDICLYNYFVFDKVSGQQALAQYNLLIAQDLLKNTATKAVYQNEVAVIIKNGLVGGDCIAERPI